MHYSSIGGYKTAQHGITVFLYDDNRVMGNVKLSPKTRTVTILNVDEQL